MLTLLCLFGLEIHLAIPRRDLDQKSRMIGSAEAHHHLCLIYFFFLILFYF